MKKYLALTIYSFLLVAGSVSAQTPEEEVIYDKISTTAARARTLLLEAESRAMERCDTTRIVITLPSGHPQADTNGLLTWVDETYEKTVTIEWSGACVEGKREGEGILNWVNIAEIGSGHRTIMRQRSEGHFVKGQRLGLWCGTRTFQDTMGGKQLDDGSTSDSDCSVLAGHGKYLTDSYLKQADGRWRQLASGSNESYLAAGALEAQSAKILADAAAGKTDLKIALVVQNRTLDDLVPGSKIVLALSAAPLSLKDKRVAIVLSSQTVREMERFKRERQTLIDASAELSGEAATARAKFIQASAPNRLLSNIIKLVQKYAGEAQPADDLTGLQTGRFDYALVVDWKSMTRFDLLGKYSSFPVAPSDLYKMSEDAKMEFAVAGDSLGGFLIGRDLKAVNQTSYSVSMEYNGMLDDSPSSGDERYMQHLAKSYADHWGDDLNYPNSVFYLDHMLQGKQ